jgi:ABC-2 type transport system permease protein
LSTLRLAARQIRYEDLAFRRNPAKAFFTVVFPLIFLVIFTLMFGNDELDIEGGTVKVSTFYVAAIVALTVVNSCYTGLAMSFSIARDQGLLKRVRGTPLPPWMLVFGRVAHLTLVMLVLAVFVAVFGRIFYDVTLPTTTLPAVVITLLVGAAAFSALGIAVVAIIPNADAAPAVVNGSILPLLFISDVFIPPDADTPRWVEWISNVFPVRHLSEALQTGFNPFETGMGFEWTHLAVVAAWGVVGAVAAMRFTSWEPHV